MKIPYKRVLSDDCVIHVGRVWDDGQIVDEGQTYNIHEGEWIEIIPVTSTRHWIELDKLQKAYISGDPEKGDKALGALAELLAKRVKKWSWTDNEGKALPQPTAKTIKELDDEEFLYLITAISGETTGERKNESKPSAMK